ncbi:ganglioside-induced differentiation-associated protein 2 [Thecamonas trahens ATCC 50062]|uniref:Ganglioside-induced differentiation-associated protein 2 n=1 Tax=Thecamonas trahens ATCC 50062 TaxID=461836 RepID=A0A0L0D2C0_THETB|nr:ganglioside-induced differentiation-associated protein 2 [Thecamonas trahens ATCC 50062]KNC46285.1 ganglioside-induced differentiation-associated protein 2 [Thecamonas trahens ATCC 50062]|eukprot:XP_013760579.1 ganglioside-induced differentiation-associated protein 2 [Thecamonas trahens ATCC 50062]
MEASTVRRLDELVPWHAMPAVVPDDYDAGNPLWETVSWEAAAVDTDGKPTPPPPSSYRPDDTESAGASLVSSMDMPTDHVVARLDRGDADTGDAGAETETAVEANAEALAGASAMSGAKPVSTAKTEDDGNASDSEIGGSGRNSRSKGKSESRKGSKTLDPLRALAAEQREADAARRKARERAAAAADAAAAAARKAETAHQRDLLRARFEAERAAREHARARGEGDDESSCESAIKFPIMPFANSKIVLWCGNVYDLAVDVMVTTNNETLSETSGLAGRLLKLAGPELVSECRSREPIRTGEVRETLAGNLPCAYVLHTVAPRFNTKYRTAAENALHNCYRNCLQRVKELELRSIGFCVVHGQKRGFPRAIGTHVAVRTIRRFVEKWHTDIDTIVLCVPNPAEYAVYAAVLPLYFPRSLGEVKLALTQLPEDTGDINGETILEERIIRIRSSFGVRRLRSGPHTRDHKVSRVSRVSSAGPSSSEAEAEYGYEYEYEYAGYEDVDLVAGPILWYEPLLPAPGAGPSGPDMAGSEAWKSKSGGGADQDISDLARMQASPDDVRPRPVLSEADRREAELVRRYQMLLKTAAGMDLSDIEAARVVYLGGHDRAGRRIVVFVGARVSTQPPHLDRILLYTLLLMDSLVSKRYTCVYLHTDSKSENQPDTAWLKKLYSILPPLYKANVNSVVVVHPTFWLKTVMWFAKAFVTAKFFTRIAYCKSLAELFEHVHPSQLELPQHVVGYDEAKYGPLDTRVYGTESPASVSQNVL